MSISQLVFGNNNQANQTGIATLLNHVCDPGWLVELPEALSMKPLIIRHLQAQLPFHLAKFVMRDLRQMKYTTLTANEFFGYTMYEELINNQIEIQDGLDPTRSSEIAAFQHLVDSNFRNRELDLVLSAPIELEETSYGWLTRVIRDNHTLLNTTELEEFLRLTRCTTAIFKVRQRKDKPRVFILSLPLS